MPLAPSPTRAGPRPLVVVATAGAPVPGWVRDWADGEPDVVPAGPALVVSAAARGADGPLLLLRSPAPEAPRTVVVAVQEQAADAPVVEAAVALSEACGARLRIVHAVPRSFGARSVGLGEAVQRGRRLVGGAAAGVGGSAVGELVRAWPHEVLDETLDADLLVVGGARPAQPTELGPTTRSALLHAPCPVLVVPRAA
ncbi:universal stress protein [Pseudonocardia xishanensis]|uniref:UspA domain-containing protein n=1 Tax=Pseudonocardia xishanensis TaxID=630995 RepID=A0ABP8RLI6_9PSEU